MRKRQPWERKLQITVELAEWEAQRLAARELRRLLDEDLGPQRDDLLTQARWIAWGHEVVGPSVLVRRLLIDHPTADLLLAELCNEGTLRPGPGDTHTVVVRPVNPPPDEWFLGAPPSRDERSGSDGIEDEEPAG